MSVTVLKHVSSAVPQFPAASSPARATRAGLTLTRRGRFLLIGLPMMLLALTVLLAAGFFGSSAKAAVTGGQVAGNGSAVVTVHQGQTLWAIAAAADSARDTRDVMADIVDLNSLHSSVVQPGQQLYVPGRR
jgi:nucleoid-associated protein YgaU